MSLSCRFRFSLSSEVTSILEKVFYQDFYSLSELVFAPESYRLSKKLHFDYPEIESRLSKGHKYDLTTNIFEKLSELFFDDKPNNNEEYIQIIGRINNRRVLKWIKKEYVNEHENIYK